MFQNLSAEMTEEESETETNEIIIISKKIMNEWSNMNNFWAVELLKYSVKIENDKIMTMFDSEIKINIMLYIIILKLRLTAHSKIAVHMKEAENHKSFFINYVSDISVCIKNVKVFQFFFLLKKKTNFCILKHSFKAVTWMQYMILNNEAVRMTIFDENDEMIQIIFQSYFSKLSENKQEFEMIKFLN